MATSATGRRPKTSASRPEKGRMAVLARPYAEPIQTKLSPPLSSLVIVGTAVETAVRSSALRRLASRMAVKQSQKEEPLPPFAAGSGEAEEKGMVKSESCLRRSQSSTAIEKEERTQNRCGQCHVHEVCSRSAGACHPQFARERGMCRR